MKQVFGTSALAVLLTFGGQTVSAQDFGKGLEAAQVGDFETALREWQPLADQGSASAQVMLGWMYDNGRGVPQDYADAAKWYRLAAEQGDADAQFYLGTLYDNGQGVGKDNLYALMWFNIADQSGNEFAANARNVVAGRMTAEDISKAQKLARECVAKDYKDC